MSADVIGTSSNQWPLRRASLIYPSPVAIACGRVLRARNSAERVNACLKAAEVFVRYLAAVAVASFASRDGDDDATLSELSGNLSFGDFLNTVQQVAGAKGPHPASSLLAQGFKKTKKNRETFSGATDSALVALLELRNDLGHELINLDEAKASAIEASQAPETKLVEALQGVEELLSKPLFVIEDQQWTPEEIVLRRLLLMGEADPVPHELKVPGNAGVSLRKTPYVAINKSCLQLPPWLLWGIDKEHQTFSLLFLDAVEDMRARYTSINGSKQHRADDIPDTIRGLCSGCRRPAEAIVLLDGRHLAREWAVSRERIEENGRRQEGLVDWHAFDASTVKWFSKLLQEDADDAHGLIRERLLDGRYHVEPDEIRQLVLLFGRPPDVRGRLQRDMLDLRIIDPETQRPEERELVESENLLEALKRAVRFFAQETAIGQLAEDLRRTEGPVDYMILREIFVNQAIHQDYKDSSAAGQIEIHPEKVTVFNTGSSLVPAEELLDGGKSQSRNPLIARALRLIGFAEISGSGIRAVHRACKQARRKAPTFKSDKEANTFTLTLDWSESTSNVDTYWQTLVGVDLTMHQAAVLNAIAEAPSVTIGVIESATQLDSEQIVDALDFLLFQVLVEQDESNYSLAEHIREKLG